MSDVVITVFQISRHSKITNLKKKIKITVNTFFSGMREVQTLQVLLLSRRMLRAARSLWTKAFLERYAIPVATS